MGLMDEIIRKQTEDYIKANDLLINLSSMNSEPLYEVVQYLLYSDLNKLNLYYIDSNKKIERLNSDDKDYIGDFLEVIRQSIRLGDRKDEILIYSDKESLKNFSTHTRSEILHFIELRADYYFKISELLSFKPLEGILHLGGSNDHRPSNTNKIIIELEERINELLDELRDKDRKIDHLLSYSSSDKTSTDNHLVKQLRIEVKKQQEEILALQNKLENSVDKDGSLNPKDSAYYLIAVLKELLLDPEITGFMFQTDKDKGKKEPTQAVLVNHIANMYIKSLSTRNISGLLADANRTFTELTKSIFAKADNMLIDAKKNTRH